MTMNSLKLRDILLLTLVPLITLAGSASRAQDVELFGGLNPASTTLPNVLIIVDNTANWNTTVAGTQAWDPELQALSNTIQGLNARGLGSSIRVGLMLLTPGGFRRRVRALFHSSDEHDQRSSTVATLH